MTHSSLDQQLSSYDFELPAELIAQQPASPRDHSRMMVLSKDHDSCSHQHFYDLLDFLPENTTLVLNNTKVLPARLMGTRASGGRIEGLLLSQKTPGVWECLLKKAKRIQPEEILSFGQGHLQAIAQKRLDNGHWILEFEDPDTLYERLEKYAYLPLPPYIERREASEEVHEQDHENYQTCYAKNEGAVAAPTAGLHFTDSILDQVRARQIPIIEVTLHVGLGTFNPIRNEDVKEHDMHFEAFSISPQAAEALKASHDEGRRVIAVGTTVVRVLESMMHQFGQIQAGSGDTNLFIYPPYDFQLVSGLLTNFHLPKSSLLLLVSALYGRTRLMKAYQAAVEEQYRFFSYGDCMLIL